MASNKIPETQSRLWALATDAADGLKDHGADIKVKQNTEADVRADLAGSKAGEKAWQDAQTAESEALGVHRTANSNVKGFLGLAKRQLADEAGKLPGGLWPVGTTAIPDDETKRLALIDKIATYLHDHANAANEEKNFTEARALALRKALTDARTALNQAVRERVTAKTARDQADGALYNRLSGLLGELGQLLADASEDWYWFGFVPPAGAERPAKPEGLHGQQVSPTALAAGWPHPPRADKCRLLVQVAGRDAAFIAREWVRDNDDLIQDLPAKATIRLKLQATNAAGESPEGEVVEITLG
jgi:hypothetical protein